MNTPPSKPLKRYTNRALRGDAVIASYIAGSLAPAFTLLIGTIVAEWSHVENSMIGVLGVLMGDCDGARRSHQVFRSIVNQRDRIKVMRSLLEDSPINAGRGREFDQAVNEFESLNASRNSYVHGLWWTRHDDKVFLQDAGPDQVHMIYGEHREVKANELEQAASRMLALHRLALKLVADERGT